MKVAYFPGCTAETSAKEYDHSIRVVCKNLGIELSEIPDWSCCGATAAHATDHFLALGLAARNLAIAEKGGFSIVTASCSSCYQRLALAQVGLAQSRDVLEKVNQLTGYNYQGTLKVRSILEVIAGLDEEQVRPQIVKSLKDLRVAVYYGCLLVRPSQIKIDDPENPQVLDKILRLTGAETLNWTHKTECCGASLLVSNEDLVVSMVANILKAAVSAGANCIATSCGMCHLNLDAKQEQVSRLLGVRYNLPVFYFSQLLGLAMGLHPKEMGIYTHFVDTRQLISKVVLQ